MNLLCWIFGHDWVLTGVSTDCEGKPRDVFYCFRCGKWSDC